MGKLELSGLYGITGEAFAGGKTTLEIVKALIEGGVKVIQYREKEKERNIQYQECVAIRKLTKEAGVTFIVNDAVDLALAVEADGVHIGQTDLPFEVVKKLAPHLIIGVSTHCEAQAIKAIEQGADYLGVGPMFKTQTKQNVEQSQGLKYLEWVAKNVRIPYVTIGGITEERLEELAIRKAPAFAMISEVVGAEDIVAKVKRLHKVWENCSKL